MEQKISIIIVNWNGKADTLDCLESVSRIDYPNFEVIVVDNASSDGSIEAIKSRFKGVILIQNERNQGFCTANNTAIKLALEQGAEYFFILNNDTVVEPSVLRKLKKAIDEDEKRGAINPVIASFKNKTEFFFSGTKIDWGNGDLFGQYAAKEVLSGNTLLHTDFANWCAVFIKKKAIEETGFLDERFFAYYEDIDWSIRSHKAGLTTMLYPEILVYHKGSISTGGNYSPLVYYYLFRNRLLFIKKHASFFRKVQFSINYVKDLKKTHSRLSKESKLESAQSVRDGFWSGVRGSFREVRVKAPDSFGKSADIYLWFLAIRQLFTRM